MDLLGSNIKHLLKGIPQSFCGCSNGNIKQTIFSKSKTIQPSFINDIPIYAYIYIYVHGISWLETHEDIMFDD